MKDFFGNELAVGDTVAYMVVGYRSLRTGKIKSIGAAKITITHPEFMSLDDTYQFPEQVIKKFVDKVCLSSPK